MKDGIIYPLITTIIIAIAGFISTHFGFDFNGMFSILCSQYLKEFLLSSLAFLLMIATITYGGFKWFFQEKLKKYDEIKQELKDTKNNLSESEKAFNELLKTSEDLKIRYILKEYKKEDNQ